MKLSHSDLAAIYKACECLLKEGHGFDFWYVTCAPVIQKIIDFYSAEEWGNWSEDHETRQNERIMALLFYVAANGEL